MSFSPESLMATEPLHQNQEAMDSYFGSFFGLMRKALVAGGSELGLGMTLFSLAVSIRASRIIEIGRFKGFSTLCLASALRFIDVGWQEPQQHKQRPDIDYKDWEAPKQRQLLSIDPFPTQEAADLIVAAKLENYVRFINARSDEVTIEGLVDLIFIDGDHSYEGCKADVFNYIPWYLRPGGYFILHDYYGWYDAQGNNNSPVKLVIDELIEEGLFEHLLVDTGYQSFTVFRNPVAP
ncbi:class I SAM-dependent methyltransferase [Thermosynechococcaceae cyanobacterium Okahandja]